MAAQVLSTTEKQNSYVIVIHTDDTKAKDGSPDPEFVRTFEFGKDQSLQRSLDEAMLLCTIPT